MHLTSLLISHVRDCSNAAGGNSNCNSTYPGGSHRLHCPFIPPEFLSVDPNWNDQYWIMCLQLHSGWMAWQWPVQQHWGSLFVSQYCNTTKPDHLHVYLLLMCKLNVLSLSLSLSLSLFLSLCFFLKSGGAIATTIIITCSPLIKWDHLGRSDQQRLMLLMLALLHYEEDKWLTDTREGKTENNHRQLRLRGRCACSTIAISLELFFHFFI